MWYCGTELWYIQGTYPPNYVLKIPSLYQVTDNIRRNIETSLPKVPVGVPPMWSLYLVASDSMNKYGYSL